MLNELSYYEACNALKEMDDLQWAAFLIEVQSEDMFRKFPKRMEEDIKNTEGGWIKCS